MLTVRSQRAWDYRGAVRPSLLAAPLPMLGYGLVRLVDGLDGDYGPGLAWTVGHLLFLASIVLFVPVTLGVRRAAATTGPAGELVARISSIVAFVGLAAFLRSIVIDLVVGFLAPNHEAMSPLFDQAHGFPADVVPAAAYDFAQLLFPAGLIVMLLQLVLARPRRVPMWSPALVALGASLIGVTLDLLPLIAVFFLAALIPVRGQFRDTGHTS